MKILILLRSLSVGGAERRASILADGLQQAGHELTLAVFYGGGELEPQYPNSGIRRVNLAKSGRWDMAGFLLRFLKLMREVQPDVVYSFLSGPNLLAACTQLMFHRTRLVWAVCASRMDWAAYEGVMRWAHRAEILMSRIPQAIISNSCSGRADAVAAGFPPERIHVVHNGFETERFRPDPNGRVRMRAAWGISEGIPVFGLVARLDPMKGHADFLHAAAICLNQRPEARFVLVGSGPSTWRERIDAQIQTLGLSASVIRIEESPDMPSVYNALDVLVSASIFGEGLSNAVGEAMASGTPCVVTDVGDSAFLVGDYGRVVPPGDPGALAASMLSLLAQAEVGAVDRQGMRSRIVEQFSVKTMMEETLAVMRTVREA
ncbi:MAG: glycosyltransferase [Methylococcaceae bacterium]